MASGKPKIGAIFVYPAKYHTSPKLKIIFKIIEKTFIKTGVLVLCKAKKARVKSGKRAAAKIPKENKPKAAAVS